MGESPHKDESEHAVTLLGLLWVTSLEEMSVALVRDSGWAEGTCSGTFPETGKSLPFPWQ